MSKSFINKWLLEPVDDVLFNTMKVAEKAGIWEPFRNIFYQGEGVLYDILFKQLFKFEISGAEYLTEYKDKAVIYACNHQSLLDPIISGLAVFKSTSGRQPFQLAKHELFTSPMFNMFTRVNRGIPIKRGDSDELAMEKIIELINEGHQAVMYPEGTLNPGNGKFLKPHTGIARIVYGTKVDVIPMVIYGSDKIYGKNAKMPSIKGKLAVKFGKPLPYEKLFSSSIRTVSNIDSDEMYKASKKATLKIFSQIQSLWLDLHETVGKDAKENKKDSSAKRDLNAEGVN